ncbi:MAG TPA: hypothetical protein VG455_00105, partial [Acidimicrobiales bacterium]|nr:hypothetical protein [Acidimicrobiales bacterium]
MGDRELAELAARQDGLVARHQARDHLSRKQLESRLATGRLVIVRRGVYRFAGAAAGPWHDLRAAVLAAGPSAVASHHSAAELWGFSGVAADRPELSVPAPMRLRLPGVRGHQTRRLPEAHTTTRRGIPVTTAARTLVDLCGRIGADLLGHLVDECRRRALTDLRELEQVHRDLVSRATRLATISAILEARRQGPHPGDSAGEMDLARLLTEAGLPMPTAQHQVVTGGTVYVLDLAYPELRLGFEYDGWAVHGTRSAFDRDRIRGNALAAAGWTILHVTSQMSRDAVV